MDVLNLNEWKIKDKHCIRMLLLVVVRYRNLVILLSIQLCDWHTFSVLYALCVDFVVLKVNCFRLLIYIYIVLLFSYISTRIFNIAQLINRIGWNIYLIMLFSSIFGRQGFVPMISLSLASKHGERKWLQNEKMIQFQDYFWLHLFD